MDAEHYRDITKEMPRVHRQDPLLVGESRSGEFFMQSYYNLKDEA